MSSITEVISHWSTLIENFQYSPQQFYKEVEEAIKKWQIPNATITKTQLKESHLFSAKREYLRVSFTNDFYFVICGAPFGTGFFVSWWFLEPPAGCLNTVPIFALLGAAAKPWTYFRADTIQMFQTATHSAVMKVVDSLTTEKGLPMLTESERKPIMTDFFRK